MMGAITRILSMSALCLTVAGCATSSRPVAPEPVGGLVQEHGGANPVPIVWPSQRQYSAPGWVSR